MLSLAVLFVAFVPVNTTVHAQAPSMLIIGSSNGDVWDLQYRLNEYNYHLKIDGIYGYQTYQAVKSFQTKFGLMSDGIVGPITWGAVKEHTLSKNELELLTRLVYSEARGEVYKGQVAVAAVVLNRVHSDKFPNTVRSVIFEKDAFTAINDGQFWLTPNGTAKLAALDAVRGWDPSNGALFYFNPSTTTSSWIWSRPELGTIGNHIFAE